MKEKNLERHLKTAKRRLATVFLSCSFGFVAVLRSCGLFALLFYRTGPVESCPRVY